ncbi:MAG TPA: 3-methyl-2-oxobutanoate hydroxymethyltransferase [Acidimicrobiales bacterium]|nr:3-methyl-2-oxobutanoate hydroxymethyltransferase [Acidimicrobiales bacterium]
MSEQEKVTVPSVRSRKRRNGDDPVVMVTAYDEPWARLVDRAGVDVILVGDTLAEIVLGHENTLQVGIEDMAHHVAAVARARPRALVVGDLPWMTYHLEPAEAVRNAARLVRAGAGAVKLEGGRVRLPAVEAILSAEIPVMAHLGLTPQSVHAMGGYRVQGRQLEAAKVLIEDAIALAEAGCFAVVLEGVPDVLAERVTAVLEVPTIGIGAGPSCDGQVLVLHDLLGMSKGRPPKFVRRYAEIGDLVVEAVGRYASDVRTGAFPGDEETYHGSSELREGLGTFK